MWFTGSYAIVYNPTSNVCVSEDTSHEFICLDYESWNHDFIPNYIDIVDAVSNIFDECLPQHRYSVYRAHGWCACMISFSVTDVAAVFQTLHELSSLACISCHHYSISTVVRHNYCMNPYHYTWCSKCSDGTLVPDMWTTGASIIFNIPVIPVNLISLQCQSSKHEITDHCNQFDCNVQIGTQWSNEIHDRW